MRPEPEDMNTAAMLVDSGPHSREEWIAMVAGALMAVRAVAQGAGAQPKQKRRVRLQFPPEPVVLAHRFVLTDAATGKPIYCRKVTLHGQMGHAAWLDLVLDDGTNEQVLLAGPEADA